MKGRGAGLSDRWQAPRGTQGCGPRLAAVQLQLPLCVSSARYISKQSLFGRQLRANNNLSGQTANDAKRNDLCWDFFLTLARAHPKIAAAGGTRDLRTNTSRRCLPPQQQQCSLNSYDKMTYSLLLVFKHIWKPWQPTANLALSMQHQHFACIKRNQWVCASVRANASNLIGGPPASAIIYGPVSIVLVVRQGEQ